MTSCVAVCEEHAVAAAANQRGSAQGLSGDSSASAIMRRMRCFTVVGSLLFLACAAPEAQRQRQSDGSWAFTCELSMEECIRQVEKTCRTQRYRILNGSSETRVRDVPPVESTYHTSRLHVVCSNDVGSPVQATPTQPAEGAPTRMEVACTPGETRECVGPAACKGGQSCLPDRSGFGPCDCGPAPAPAAPPPPAPAPSVSPPASAGAAAPVTPAPQP
jgi:hypothetical protein